MILFYYDEVNYIEDSKACKDLMNELGISVFKVTSNLPVKEIPSCYDLVFLDFGGLGSQYEKTIISNINTLISNNPNINFVILSQSNGKYNYYNIINETNVFIIHNDSDEIEKVIEKHNYTITHKNYNAHGNLKSPIRGL